MCYIVFNFLWWDEFGVGRFEVVYFVFCFEFDGFGFEVFVFVFGEDGVD